MKKDFLKKLILGFLVLIIVTIVFIRFEDIALFLNIRIFLRDLFYNIKGFVWGVFS
ncbi:MAG: hypothetical protein KJ566_00855 [Nanoarchaeota archaeon]|nr:hypothetical protein [Nanoarchaeota archaeon]